jgi:PBP1b-binding outer membrane lipoprotein LpoB
MKSNDLFVSCIAALLVSGCSSKKDANSELQKASAVMAQPEQSQAAAAAEPSQSIPGSTAAPVAPTSSPAQEMNQAMTAYKAGDLDDAVRRLQKLRATPVLSAEKRIAVNDATAAVMGEIYALAAKGDARAMQAVKLYEQMQTHRD